MNDLSSEKIRKLVDNSKHASALVLGSGVTGQDLVAALNKFQIKAVVLDDAVISEEKRGRLSGCTVSFLDNLANRDLEVPNDVRFALVSPGISPNSSLVSKVLEADVQIISELDFATAFLGMPEVAVTGTNGKTTVTSLIQCMLNSPEKQFVSVGNIGRSLSKNLAERDESNLTGGMVAELSSYQIEWSRNIHAPIAVCLNITEDHLERHKTIEGYAAAKRKLFDMQDSNDWAIVNHHDDYCESMTQNTKAQILKFSFGRIEAENSCFFDTSNKSIYFCVGERESVFNCEKTKLLGRHNMLNLAASVAAAKLAGAKDENIQKVIDEFETLEHRLEQVLLKDGVLWINDSKSTNVDSVGVAVEAMQGKAEIILLLGGKAKLGGWDSLVKSVASSIKEIVTFGADGKMISEKFVGKVPLTAVQSVEDAVKQCSCSAMPGDVVLFSPGCASFDAYQNFEERGAHFKELVSKYVK